MSDPQKVEAGTCWRHVDGFSDNTDFTRYNGNDVEWVMKGGALGNPEWNWTLEEALDAERLGRWVRIATTPSPTDAVIASYREEYRCLAGWWRHHTLTAEQNSGLEWILGRMRDAIKSYDAASPK